MPLYSNFGVAQIEELLRKDEIGHIDRVVEQLRADGVIIHVNPMQEWLQPEGDQIRQRPINTITAFLEKSQWPVIVKEVGQGMGPDSLSALFQLPLQAIEFGAFGGTNFAKLEMLRTTPQQRAIYEALAHVGHTAIEMLDMANTVIVELGDKCRCKDVIISGGVRNFLDGYYCINVLETNCVYGQASAFLRYAREDYDTLFSYVKAQVDGLKMAKAYLKVKGNG